MLYGRGHNGTILWVQIHIDLETNPKIIEIDSRLDGETRSWQQAPGVAAFDIIEIGSKSVHRRPRRQAVTGTVQQTVFVSFANDEVTSKTIQLPSLQRLATIPCFMQPTHYEIAGTAHDVKHFGLLA